MFIFYSRNMIIFKIDELKESGVYILFVNLVEDYWWDS